MVLGGLYLLFAVDSSQSTLSLWSCRWDLRNDNYSHLFPVWVTLHPCCSWVWLPCGGFVFWVSPGPVYSSFSQVIFLFSCAWCPVVLQGGSQGSPITGFYRSSIVLPESHRLLVWLTSHFCFLHCITSTLALASLFHSCCRFGPLGIYGICPFATSLLFKVFTICLKAKLDSLPVVTTGTPALVFWL